MTSDRVRPIANGDAERLGRLFADRGPAHFECRRAEQRDGLRVLFVGLEDGAPAGYGSIVWESRYPPFREQAIPEIQDLRVAPDLRRRGVASRILDAAEKLAAKRSDVVGIGVGLHPGYRAAQHLYALRGFVPDGRGVYYRGRHPEEGETVRLDDDLVMYLTKSIQE